MTRVGGLHVGLALVLAACGTTTVPGTSSSVDGGAADGSGAVTDGPAPSLDLTGLTVPDGGTTDCPGGCAAGTSCCFGTCRPHSADPDRCGACGAEVCPPPPPGWIRTCVSGGCGISSCPDGTVVVNNTCALKPVQIFSDSFLGPAKTTLSAQKTIYGRMLNLAANNAQACVEVVGSTDGSCANDWTTLPNNEWSYDAGSKEWRSTLPPNLFPAGQYRNFLRNSITGVEMTPWVVTLTSCEWTAITPGPVAKPTAPCGPASAGGTTMANGYTWTCVCP